VDKNEILSWTTKIMFVIVLVIIINILSDKFGEGKIFLLGLSIAALLFLIGKALLKK
jgi:hypothetical protein